jgi:hypothetical protein
MTDNTISTIFNESDQVRELLAMALSSGARAGEFAAGGEASELPGLPGLDVLGVGPLSLPIREHDAEAIKRVAEPSPVDPTGCTWELQPRELTIHNPQWNIGLNKLIGRSATILGCSPGDVTFELRKALLQAPGGSSFGVDDSVPAAHRGIPFGTLVVKLPSAATGGSLVVSHGKRKKQFDFGVLCGRNAVFRVATSDCGSSNVAFRDSPNMDDRSVDTYRDADNLVVAQNRSTHVAQQETNDWIHQM